MRKSQRKSTFTINSFKFQNLFFPQQTSTLHLLHSPNKKVRLLNQDPPIYQIDDFLSVNEYHYFNQICTQYEQSFLESFTENDENGQVISEERTSRFIYLSKGQDTVTRNVERKAAEFIGVSSTTVEPLQIVSYTQGQYFNLHHDAGTLHDDGTVELVAPRRLYLNTLPEGEGHTEFPSLGLSVQPKKNSVIIFPNILSNGQPDPRTVHVAKTINRNGLRKFGVNIWITDMDMQCLASSPPTSPLMKRYEKGSSELILEQNNKLNNVTIEKKSDEDIQSSKRKRKNQKRMRSESERGRNCDPNCDKVEGKEVEKDEQSQSKSKKRR